MLDEITEGNWLFEIASAKAEGGFAVVHGRITLVASDGVLVADEIGCVPLTNQAPPFEVATRSAVKRAASTLGLARNLWQGAMPGDGDDDPDHYSDSRQWRGDVDRPQQARIAPDTASRQPLLGPHPLRLMISTRQTKDRPNAKAVASWSRLRQTVSPTAIATPATARSKQVSPSAVESTSRPAVLPEPCIRYAGREITPGAATVPDSIIGNYASTSNGCWGSTKSKEEYQTDDLWKPQVPRFPRWQLRGFGLNA